nr:hypothetical protein [Candidatus Enterousia merdequi]
MPNKKTIKKPVAKKAIAKTTPVVEHKCECGGHCHCRAHVVKHIILLVVVFALGMICGRILLCGHGYKHFQKTHPVFVNGCLDMNSIKCPKMQEKLLAADVDANNCISIEEYKAVKKEMRPMRQDRRGMRGPKVEK